MTPEEIYKEVMKEAFQDVINYLESELQAIKDVEVDSEEEEYEYETTIIFGNTEFKSNVVKISREEIEEQGLLNKGDVVSFKGTFNKVGEFSNLEYLEFASREFEKFKDMPKISTKDICHTDMDLLIKDLQKEE